ncbi:hypothetical protein BGZ83_009042 [Gryganskiella cystojenkinii]|nr:hypothetical protein BGZ83_009042 [Gryganskiella cystojenkinii]
MANAKSILETIFGMLGIIFWSFQLLPQVWDNYKAKTTKGLSVVMFVFWSLAALGFGSYSIVEDLSIPITLQPHIFGCFSLIVCLQCFYYGTIQNDEDKDDIDLSDGQILEGGERNTWEQGKKPVVGRKGRSIQSTLVLAVICFLVSAGVEVGAVYGTKAGLAHNVPGTLDAAGSIPVVLLGLGFMPQYLDIFSRRSVVGVSMVFITGDALGSVFSLISLALREHFDLLAALNYVIVLICDLIVVAFFLWYNKLHPGLARDPDQVQEQGSEEGDTVVDGTTSVCKSQLS